MLVDYNLREFIRPSFQSIAVLERLNPEMGSTWAPTEGYKVLLFDHDGVEYVGVLRRGEQFDWVADITVDVGE
jgi:hypothetical protein